MSTLLGVFIFRLGQYGIPDDQPCRRAAVMAGYKESIIKLLDYDVQDICYVQMYVQLWFFSHFHHLRLEINKFLVGARLSS